MTINERIKHFRKNILNLSQAEFAKEIGMKQTGVSYMERNDSTVTEQSLKTICLVYNLNENWLRYGTNPMYIESDTFSLDQFIKEKGMTDNDLKIVKAYFELDPDIRQSVFKFFKNALGDDEPTVENLYEEAPKTPEELERHYDLLHNDTETETG